MIACQLRLGDGPAYPEPVEELVDELARRAGLTRSQAYWLRLATDEITTNIGQHGYRDHAGVVDLTGDLDERRAWVRIEDDAPAFDPRGYDPSPRLDVPPAQRAAGGYGLLLALSKVDEFSYEWVGGRNRNTLAMMRPEPAPAAD